MKKNILVIFINLALLFSCTKKNKIVFDSRLYDSIYFEKETYHVLVWADTLTYGKWIKKRIGDTLRNDIRIGKGNILNITKTPPNFTYSEKVEQFIMAYKSNDTVYLIIYVIPALIKTNILKDEFYAYEIVQGDHSPSAYDETYRSETFLKIRMAKSDLKFKYNRFEVGDTIYAYLDYTTKPYRQDGTDGIVENFKGAFKTIILHKDTFDKIEPYSFLR